MAGRLLRGCRSCFSQISHIQAHSQLGSQTSTGFTATSHQLQHARAFAAGSHGEGITYEGLTLHKPARWHVMWGTGMCSLMWFWVMYRAYYDWDTFLYGHAIHFEHDDHDEHAPHGNGH